MSTQQENGFNERNERDGQQDSQWRADDSQRLSRYDEGNETNNESLSAAENRYEEATPMNAERWKSPEEIEEEKYGNTYGMGSDSSRSMMSEGNAMSFENDREGQLLDDEYQAAKRDEQIDDNRTNKWDASENRFKSENEQRDLGL